MCGCGSADELCGRRLVGRWDGQASCGGDDLVLGPCLGEVVESSPEWGEFSFDLQARDVTWSVSRREQSRSLGIPSVQRL